MRCLLLVLVSMICSSAVLAEPTAILFVGNSYTFGRVDPVESYNAGKVDDMTRPRPDLPGAPFTDTSGTNPWEPHPWGGVPGIFKQLTIQAQLDYAVSLSTRNAATLRGHFLNTANANWDLRGEHRGEKMGCRCTAGAKRRGPAAGAREKREPAAV